MRIAAILTALMLLPVAGCTDDGPTETASLDAQVDAPSSTRMQLERPFKGRFDTTFGELGDASFDCDGNPETQPTLIEALGTATHLGRTIYVSDSEIDFSTLIQCGRGAFIAADGDQILFDYVGPFTPPDENGNITFEGDWWVAEGTGRFDDVTGGGTYEGSANAIAEQGEVSFLGTLGY